MKMPDRFIFDFVEGNKDQADLLGGKGANLAEMTHLGLPVPPGFTITTDACRVYLATGASPEVLEVEVNEHLATLERQLGRTLGDENDPLLVSVRSGARYSMPGMMETVLNVGLNDSSVEGLARQASDGRFAWDSYRRLVHMFGKTVLGIDGDRFEDTLTDAKKTEGVVDDTSLDEASLRRLVAAYKEIIRDVTGEEFPQNPREQLRLSIEAVFRSWNAERAVVYRHAERIPDDAGTAVNVVAMVFGNVGDDSGTGVAFTRDPATGAQGIYGDYLANAQGEDVVAGIRNTVPLQDLENRVPAAYAELLQGMEILERHYRDLCDIEFTVERGKLWFLQTRVGKRTAAAAFRIAHQLWDEGVISADEAVLRVKGAQLAQLMFPQFDPAAVEKVQPIARGIDASPGAAVGKVVFAAATATEWAARGEDVILVRRETNPDDLAGMIAARGILTSRGGKTSHAAVVARGMGKPCVVGTETLEVDTSARSFSASDGTSVHEGDVISLDGASGAVYLGELPVKESEVVGYFTGDSLRGELLEAIDALMRHADAVRRMRVRANADTPPDAATARRCGAEGIGLCRTEHMFLGDRRELVESVILAETDEDRRAALEPLLPLQRADFVGILRAMDGLPVTIRLLDPPLHEFLPDETELAVAVALAHERGTDASQAQTRLAAVRRLSEQNPMLGLRGVRLGLVFPDLFRLQVRAIAEATAVLSAEGLNPQPEIMVPLVGSVVELELVRADAEAVLRDVAAETGIGVDALIGTMIELPRAALTAGQIAQAADFFSFGTNDLTQTTWGFSRDDVEGSFFTEYLERGVFIDSPFESLDTAGVGELVRLGTERGRKARPDLKVGVCGEHGGDPASIHFFESVRLDYVSCSPFRVPIARLESARARLL